MNMQLKTSEIFSSIEGEGLLAGFHFHFLRLSGCNLQCLYCDSKYTWTGGIDKSFEDIVKELTLLPKSENILITGGEPLMQSNEVILFIENFLKNRYKKIFLETNGSYNIENIPDFVNILMDLKPPSSKMTDYNKISNLNYLKPTDEIKVIIADNEDFNWINDIDNKYSISENFTLSLTPLFKEMPYEKLSRLIIDSGKNFRLNLQIHKIIGIK